MKRDSIGKDDFIVGAALAALKPDKDGDGVVPPLDDLSERRMIDAVMARRERLASRPTAAARIQLRWAVAAVLLIASVSSVVILSYFADSASDGQLPAPAVVSSTPVPAPMVSRRAHIPGSRFALLFGDVSCGEQAVTMGMEIPTAERIRTKNGKIALSLPSKIAVGLSENATARVLWDGAGTYGVSLMTGTALFSVDPAAERAGFFVETPAGIVRVTGTLFTVLVSSDNGVFVKLHKGKVIIEKPDGTTSAVAGPELISLGGQMGIPRDLNADIDRQLQTIRLIDNGQLFTELRDLGTQDDGEKIEQAVRLPGSRFSSRLSIQDLMSVARSRKANGDWRGAASSYNELIRNFPDSDEARTSMVSLGQIYLKHLDKPKDALRSFDRYLKAPGPLSEEALFGKAQALRALNRRDLEIETLQRFSRLYPTGIPAKSVSLRLIELGVSENKSER